MFRKEAIDRLKSPEDLDRLLVIVDRKVWIAMLGLSLICAAAVFWSIFGHIPITIDGFGVLVNPGNVRSMQSTASGQVVELLVRSGQEVKEGQLIAVMDQPELRQQLSQAQLGKELIAFNKVEAELDAERVKLERDSNQKQRDFYTATIAKETELGQRLLQQSSEFKQRQRENLLRSRELALAFHKSLKSRQEQISQLQREGLSSQQNVLSSESAMIQSETKLSDLAVQLRQLDLEEIESERSLQQLESRVSDLKLQLLNLTISEQRLSQEVLFNEKNRENKLREIDDQIANLTLRLNKESQIFSSNSGRILTLTISDGSVLGAGTSIGTIEVDDPNAELKNLAYFKVKDGKQLNEGFAVNVTPSTIKRERYGSIRGTVSSVSSFPITQEAAAMAVGNRQIAEALLESGGTIEVETTLQRDPNSFSGYAWTSKGPDLKFSAGTTTTVRVTIEMRRPITYVLPILKTWIFGQKDDAKPTL